MARGLASHRRERVFLAEVGRKGEHYIPTSIAAEPSQPDEPRSASGPPAATKSVDTSAPTSRF